MGIGPRLPALDTDADAAVRKGLPPGNNAKSSTSSVHVEVKEDDRTSISFSFYRCRWETRR